MPLLISPLPEPLLTDPENRVKRGRSQHVSMDSTCSAEFTERKKRQLQRIRSAGYHHGILRPYLSIVPNRAYGFLPRELIRARPPRLSIISVDLPLDGSRQITGRALWLSSAVPQVLAGCLSRRPDPSSGCVLSRRWNWRRVVSASCGGLHAATHPPLRRARMIPN